MAHAVCEVTNPLKFHTCVKKFYFIRFCTVHVHLLLFCCVQCLSAVGGYLGLIGDVCWVERLANMVTSHMLAICPTPFEREHLLRLLHDGTFGLGFQSSGQYS